jgi:hypothetical protein
MWTLVIPTVDNIIFICLAGLLYILVIANSHPFFGELPLPTPYGFGKASPSKWT